MALRPRNSAKAIIIHKKHLLVLRIHRGDNTWYLLPGGGQGHGETLPETLEREVEEETGAKVKTGKLLFVREYRSGRHEFRAANPDVHQVEFFFEAKLRKNAKVGKASVPDKGQEAIEWLPLSKVAKAPLYPRSLRRYIAGAKAKKFYQGDVN
jgi:8-oxo-dGTP pyrophosphatase MutT (NUDIX family)